jgi:hypothetical protein
VDNISTAAKTVMDTVKNAVVMSAERQKQEAIKNLASIFTEPQQTAPMAGPMQPTPGPVVAEPSRPTYGETSMGQSQEGRIKANLIQANPAQVTDQMANQYFPNSANGATGAAGTRGFQQTTIQVPSKDGRLRTVSAAFNTLTGKYHHPLTGAEITKDSNLDDLPDRGYANGLRPAGKSPDGQEVVADQRGGQKYTVTRDENGQEIYTPYNGPIYEGLKTAPESAIDQQTGLEVVDSALAELDKSYDPSYVGPLQGRVGNLAQSFDPTSSEKRANFMASLDMYRNAMIKAITGAQLSEPEAERIMRQMPNEKMSETDFQAKKILSRKMLNTSIERKKANLKKAGYVLDREGKAVPEKPFQPKAEPIKGDLGDGFSFTVEP